MSARKPKVLFLAPEIPALSATFVYKELLKLRSFNTDVMAASVHLPKANATQDVKDAIGDVYVVYQQNFFSFITSFFVMLFSNPLKMLQAISLLISDMFSTGIITRNSAGLVFRFLAACGFSCYIKKHEITHIHVHFAHVPTDIAMYAAKMVGINFSVQAHANDIFERGYLLKQKINRAKFFSTISDFNKKYLAQFDGSQKLKIVRCGVDETKFVPRENQPNNKIQRIGVLGRLVEKKGIHILLEALPKLKGHTSYIIEIVGDGPEKVKLESLVAKYKLQNKVIFKGEMANNKVSNWLQNLDFFVLPCVKDCNGDMDGIPVSLMEAMLKGVPVISSDISGVPELVINNQTGFSAMSGDIDACALSLNQALSSNTQTRDNISLQAIEHVKKNFSLNGNTQYLAELIHE